MCKVTLAIPVYNVSHFIESTLLSALNQDFKDYEILIIDDKGTDNSMEIIRMLQHTHPKGNIIHIKEHKQNEKISTARNTAIENANGKYIMFLDGDDTISPNCISLLYQEAENTQAEMSCGSIQQLTEERVIQKNMIYPHTTFDNFDLIKQIFYNGFIFETPLWNKLYRVDFLNKYQIRCIPHISFDDVYFTYQIMAYCKKCCFISDITYFYVIQSHSLTNTPANRNRYLQICKEYIQIQQNRKDLLRKIEDTEIRQLLTRFLINKSIRNCKKIMGFLSLTPKEKKEYCISLLDFSKVDYKNIWYYKHKPLSQIILFIFAKSPSLLKYKAIQLYSKIS